MRVLSWNLNHRAALRRVPSWIAKAVELQRADVAVFTEYVAGTDHDRFVGELSSIDRHDKGRRQGTAEGGADRRVARTARRSCAGLGTDLDAASAGIVASTHRVHNPPHM